MSLNDLPNSIYNWLKEHKKAALLLGTIPVTVPLLYFLNVWLVGSIAAAIYDFITTLPAASIIKAFFEPEQQTAAAAHVNTLTFIFNNPSTIAWAWLTRPDELQHPGIMQIWLYLNMVLGLIIAIVTGHLFWRRPWQKNTAHRVHGLEIIDSPVYGTSRWAAKKDIKHLCNFGPPKTYKPNKQNGGIILGELKGLLGHEIVRVIPGKSPKGKPSLAGHVAVFGGTGSGKTFSFVLGNIIAAVEDEQSIICTDPKGELASKLANWLENRDYIVKIFNLSDPVNSSCWNPVAECTNDTEIAEMANCLIRNAGKENSAYFLSKEIQLLEALTGLLKGDFPEKQQHLRTVMSLTAWTKEELDMRFKTAYQTGKISPTIYERWCGVSSASLDYALSGLSAKLKILTTTPLAELLSEHEINLNKIGTEKTALFCVLPISGDSEVLKPILSTFYRFLFKRLYRAADQNNGKLKTPVRLLLDEFANIGKIPGFSEIISTARSLGIHIQFILQGRSQLDDVYSYDEAKNILANCPTILLLGVPPGDQETAKMFSDILGEAAVKGMCAKEDLTMPLAHQLAHHFQLSTKNQNTAKRSLMTADEISRMDSLDCIALIQWCPPLYLKKVGWIKLPQAKEIQLLGERPVNQLVPTKKNEIEILEQKKNVVINLESIYADQYTKEEGGKNGDITEITDQPTATDAQNLTESENKTESTEEITPVVNDWQKN